MHRTRTLGTVVGSIRTAMGLASFAAPRRAAEWWAGAKGDEPATTAFVRVAGGRDVVLGAATLAATGSDSRTANMLQLGAVSDLADALATLLSAHRPDRRRALAMSALAALSGASVLVATRWTVAADQGEATPRLSDEVRAKVAVPDEVDIRGIDRART